MKTSDNTAQNLYDLLVSRDLDPTALDARGKPTENPEEGEIFSFDFTVDGNNYGTVVVLLDDASNLEVYYSDNLGRGMETGDKEEWYSLLNHLRMFAKRNLKQFSTKDMSRLKHTMRGMAAIKEGLFEGYYGNRKTSYSDQPRHTRLVIKHQRPLGENDARFRYIESLFVETAEGERFKLPFTKLAGGRAMARHIAEGGTPYDPMGQHISAMVNEMNTLSRFLRASSQVNEAARGMVESARDHYQNLRKRVKGLAGQRGYNAYKESWNPAEIASHETLVEEIKGLFLEQRIDPRIEEALPILARLAQEHAPMKETQEFDNWAEQILEGTWALPDQPDSQRRLADLMQDPLEVGPDAANATEQLYNLFGDDLLFDRLQELARQDAKADARPIIQDRLKELGITIHTAEPQSTAQPQSTAEPAPMDRVLEQEISRIVELSK